MTLTGSVGYSHWNISEQRFSWPEQFAIAFRTRVGSRAISLALFRDTYAHDRMAHRIPNQTFAGCYHYSSSLPVRLKMRVDDHMG